MINLQVASYCQNCPEFEPRVTKDEKDHSLFDSKTMSFVGSRYCDTIITCEHAARCQGIRAFIEKEIRKV